MHLAQVGLPKPYQPNAEDERARELTRAAMDRSLADNAATKAAMKLCAGCGMRRELKPNETHCCQCRKSTPQPPYPGDDLLCFRCHKTPMETYGICQRCQERAQWHRAEKEARELVV